VLVEAIKAQQREIQLLKDQIGRLDLLLVDNAEERSTGPE